MTFVIADAVKHPEIDAAYPQQWIGRVEVTTNDGRVLHGRVDVPKGDPGNSLSKEELESKALELARFSKSASDEEMQALFRRAWNLENEEHVNGWF